MLRRTSFIRKDAIELARAEITSGAVVNLAHLAEQAAGHVRLRCAVIVMIGG
jgi:hypothetical protein